MWQHPKRALEEFAQIKLKSVFMPRGCRVLHLKIRRPFALRLSLVLCRPARTTATIISSVVWPGEEKCLATGRSAFFETYLRCSQNLSQAYVRFRQRTTECMPDKLWYTRGYLSCTRTSAVWSEVHRGCWSGRLGWSTGGVDLGGWVGSEQLPASGPLVSDSALEWTTSGRWQVWIVVCS